MPAARCSHCDLMLPSDKSFCPVCKNPTWTEHLEKADHDPKWETHVHQLQRRHKPGERLRDATAQLVQQDGHTFVAWELLKDFGYVDINSGSILKINGDYYEAVASVYPGTDAASWQIIIIPIEGVFDDCIPEDIIDYPR